MAFRVIERSEWGARKPRSTTPLVLPVPRVHIHHSAAKTFGIDVTSEDNVMRSMQNYHMDARGWSDIGYNFVIFPSGNIYRGRGWNVGAHSATSERPKENAFSIGVCFAGNFQTEQVTAKAIEACVWLLKESVRVEKLKGGASVDGHKDVPGAATACPGTNLYAKLPTLRAATVVKEKWFLVSDADGTVVLQTKDEAKAWARARELVAGSEHKATVQRKWM